MLRGLAFGEPAGNERAEAPALVLLEEVSGVFHDGQVFHRWEDPTAICTTVIQFI